jgi:hypothetical protein
VTLIATPVKDLSVDTVVLDPVPDTGESSAPTRREPVGARLMRDAQLGASPWRISELVRTAAFGAIGLLAMICAYAGAANTVDFRNQIIWVAIAVGGTVFTGAAGVGWLLGGFASVSYERRVLQARARLQYGLDSLGEPALPADGRTGADVIVTARGMRCFHRPDCDVVAGKSPVAVTRAQAGSRKLEACRMCQP